MQGIKYNGEAYIKLSEAEKLANHCYEDGYRSAVQVCIATCEMIEDEEAKQAILETEHHVRMVRVAENDEEIKL